MHRSRSWILAWALISTALLVAVVGWPNAAQSVVATVADSARPRVAQAQSQEAPAQLEWLGWQFFRVTSLTGKVILFNPALNDQSLAGFRNLESPVKLDDIASANVILPTSGHGDDQGHTVEIARKTGAPVVTTFELASWMVARGVDTQKILRSGPGSRFRSTASRSRSSTPCTVPARAASQDSPSTAAPPSASSSRSRTA